MLALLWLAWFKPVKPHSHSPSGTSYSARFNYFTICVLVQKDICIVCLKANCADNVWPHMRIYITQQVNMGQDFVQLFPAITDHFAPPLFSMLHLSLEKRTWVEFKRGNGLRLWTLSRRSRFVCHMLHCAQVAYQNSFELDRIHPPCSYLIWAFTLNPLNFNRSQLIGVVFFPGWLPHSRSPAPASCLQDVLCSAVHMQRMAMCSTLWPIHLFSTNVSLDE